MSLFIDLPDIRRVWYPSLVTPSKLICYPLQQTLFIRFLQLCRSPLFFPSGFTEFCKLLVGSTMLFWQVIISLTERRVERIRPSKHIYFSFHLCACVPRCGVAINKSDDVMSFSLLPIVPSFLRFRWVSGKWKSASLWHSRVYIFNIFRECFNLLERRPSFWIHAYVLASDGTHTYV